MPVDPTAVLAWLVRSDSPHQPPSVLALADAVSEASVWLRHGRQDSWERNAQNLRTDCLRSVDSVGGRLAAACEPQLAAFKASLSTLTSRGAGTQERRREAASEAEALLAVLRAPRARRASWRDLVDSVAAGEPARQQRVYSAQMLSACSRAGHDVAAVANRLRGILEDNPYSIADETGQSVGDGVNFFDKPGTPVAERLAMCERIVGDEPTEGRCVVWLSFCPAELASPVQDLGGVMFYEARWAVPNARSDDGQSFPFRDELRAEIDELPPDIESDEICHRVVLTRVDLGRGLLAGAIDRARDVVAAIVDTAAFDANGAGWDDFGFALVMLDGQWRSKIHRSGGRDVGLRHQHREALLATADELAQQSTSFAAALIRNELDDNLREALRCTTEARSADARTSILLADRAVELVAGHESLQADELAEAVVVSWPHHQLRREIFGAIASLLHEARWNQSRTQADEVAKRVERVHGRRVSIDFRDVIANADALRELARGLGTESEVEWALRTLIEPSYALAALDDATGDASALLARWRRVRNALTHGNPATEPAIQSVTGFAGMIGSTVTRHALEAITNGTTTKRLLDPAARDAADFRQLLVDGQDFITASRP